MDKKRRIDAFGRNPTTYRTSWSRMCSPVCRRPVGIQLWCRMNEFLAILARTREQDGAGVLHTSACEAGCKRVAPLAALLRELSRAGARTIVRSGVSTFAAFSHSQTCAVHHGADDSSDTSARGDRDDEGAGGAGVLHRHGGRASRVLRSQRALRGIVRQTGNGIRASVGYPA